MTGSFEFVCSESELESSPENQEPKISSLTGIDINEAKNDSDETEKVKKTFANVGIQNVATDSNVAFKNTELALASDPSVSVDHIELVMTTEASVSVKNVEHVANVEGDSNVPVEKMEPVMETAIFYIKIR